MDFTKEEHIFRKKPMTVAAMQWTGKNFDEIKKFAVDNVLLKDNQLFLHHFVDDYDVVPVGSFILRVGNNFNFCSSSTFHGDYEAIE